MAPSRALVARSGFGKPGYCKLCAFADEGALNERLKAGWSARQVIEWLRDKYEVTVSRPTIANHKKHITAPQDKLVAFADRAGRGEKPVIHKTNNTQFLEAVRDIGYTRAIDNPEEVTLQDALAATKILEARKERQGDVFVLMAQIFSGASLPAPQEVIEGELVG